MNHGSLFSGIGGFDLAAEWMGWRLDIDTVLETVGRKVNNRFNAYGWWRNESIKAGGNAIVPQVALKIFKAIEEYKKQQLKI